MLSGANSYTGGTITAGTLARAGAGMLGNIAQLHNREGATAILDLGGTSQTQKGGVSLQNGGTVKNTILSAAGGRSGTFKTVSTQNLPAALSVDITYTACGRRRIAATRKWRRLSMGGPQVAFADEAIDSAFGYAKSPIVTKAPMRAPQPTSDLVFWAQVSARGQI